MAPKDKQIRNDNSKDDSLKKPNTIPLDPDLANHDNDKIGKLSLTPNPVDPQGGQKTSPNPAAAQATDSVEEKNQPQQPIIDALDVVRDSFHWLNDAAQQQLETMRASLKKGDEPTWQERLGEVVLDVALAAGAAAGGEFIAGELVAEEHVVLKEFVKSLFEEGINAGVSAGKSKLGEKSADSVDPFIDSQKAGVRGMHIENQTQFTTSGRHHVHTVEQAKAMKEACSRDNVEQAAVKQADATRDAWVSYLAQSAFGSSPTNKVDGSTSTNMDDQETRDRSLKKNPWQQIPADAPGVGDAALGHAPGVLAVVAELPDISNGVMHGRPEVTFAFLNGLNEENRNKYRGPVGSMHIPRIIHAKADGKFADFTINMDEGGIISNLPDERRPEGAWLVARGGVGRKPVSDQADNMEREEDGLHALLAELNVDEVKAKIGGL